MTSSLLQMQVMNQHASFERSSNAHRSQILPSPDRVEDTDMPLANGESDNGTPEISQNDAEMMEQS